MSERRQNEVGLRALRVLDLLLEKGTPCYLKGIKAEMGLSNRQAHEALEVLIDAGWVGMSTCAIWNGQFYLYPQIYWVQDTPVPVIRG